MPLDIAGVTYWTLPELVALFPAKSRPNEETLRRYIRTGKLRATKLGRAVIVSSSALRELLDPPPTAARKPEVPAVEPEKPPRRPARKPSRFRQALVLERRRQRRAGKTK